MEAGQHVWEEGFGQVETGAFGSRLESNSLEVDDLRAGFHSRVEGVMGA